MQLISNQMKDKQADCDSCSSNSNSLDARTFDRELLEQYFSIHHVEEECTDSSEEDDDDDEDEDQDDYDQEEGEEDDSEEAEAESVSPKN